MKNTVVVYCDANQNVIQEISVFLGQGYDWNRLYPVTVNELFIFDNRGIDISNIDYHYIFNIDKTAELRVKNEALPTIKTRINQFIEKQYIQLRELSRARAYHNLEQTFLQLKDYHTLIRQKRDSFIVEVDQALTSKDLISIDFHIWPVLQLS
jgi:hypothetical protein